MKKTFLPSTIQSWVVASHQNGIFSVIQIRRLYARNKLFSRVLPTPHMGYYASKLIESVVYCLSKSLGEFGIRPTVYSFRITKCLTQNPGGGTLGISGWGCAAGTLEPLTYTRAS